MELIIDQEILRDRVKRFLETQKKVSKEMDLDKAYFNQWLNGKLDLGMKSVKGVNKWLNKKMSEITHDSEEEHEPKRRHT